MSRKLDEEMNPDHPSTDGNGNSTDGFNGFGPETPIPGRLEIIEVDGDFQVVRQKRRGKPRGLNLKEKKLTLLKDANQETGLRSGKQVNVSNSVP